MLKRWHIIGLGLVLILLILVLSLVYRGAPGFRAEAAVAEVPAMVQEAVMYKLVASGYHTVASPAWAGAQTGWRSPGRYRLFFAARTAVAGADVYTAEVSTDANGQVSRMLQVARLTNTPAGDETAPVLASGWLAFATRVAGRYQSITCIPLGERQRSDVYAFASPAEEVKLGWRPGPAGQAPRLSVVAGQGAEQVQLSIDPAARRVEPSATALQYVPAVRGEMAWLPNLVSRVRELPGVGPEKIAFLENVFFTVVDYVTRLLHSRPAPAPVENLPSPTATTVEATHTATASSVAAATVPVAPATETPTTTPTLAPTPAGRRLADGIIWRGSVKPDPQRPYADVEMVEIDPALLQIKMICGTVEPKPSTGLVGTGVIPVADWPALVAAFNGGFAAMHGNYGLMIDRKVYLPPRDGIATLAVYEDGSLRIGTWGKDLVQTPDMVSFRQNCPPLIENGTITAETGKLTLWGLSVANEVYLYRSGLGINKDGRLIYVAGKPLSAYTLARALQMAGAQYAMQLDVDEFHVAFITYDVQATQDGGRPTVVGHKLRTDMRGFDGFFLRPFQLDFFYLVRRPQPLAHAVRMLAPVLPAPVPTPVALAQELPGRIAFASQRDGNWELYVMKPGQPATVRRLTDDPADDLYPAWSPDGRQLAFTSRRDGNAEIYVLDAATGAARRVTHQPSEEWAPTWAPDGQHLAYQSDRNGQSDVYACALDGSGETRLTPMEGNHEAPHWSPDGRQFVFDSDLDVTQAVHASINVYFMDADGSNPRRFVNNAESPCWRPDGRAIAFTTRRTGYWQVYLLNLDGTGSRQLPRTTYDARYPAWSPDGQWLAYAGNAEGHWEVYAVPAGGGEPLRLTYGSVDSSYPTWGPEEPR